MSKLIKIFQKLNKYLDCDLTWEYIEQLYENVQKNYEENTTNSAEAEKTETNSLQQIMNLPIIRNTISNQNVIFISLNLCTTIRTLRNEANGSYDNTLDCWEQLSHVIQLNGFLAFIYALAGLVHIEPTSPDYIKISLTAIDTYFLSLTIPGAKSYQIFQEDIIKQCLQVLGVIQRLYNSDFIAHFTCQESEEVWMQFSTLCDDLRLLFRYVHFNVHLSTRDEVLRRLVNIQFLNFDKGYANEYAADIHQKCFDIFEEMIKAHNGDAEETFLKIVKKTVNHHAYAAKPKKQHVTNMNSDYEHISDWLLQRIDKYPNILVKVLSFYIECIITNPIKGWKSEQLQRALDYAAKYDAHLFTKCNVSCLESLRDAVYADEVMVRVRTVDLIGKILQTHTEVNSQMLQRGVPDDIPREVYLIKELIDSLRDYNNNVKFKAVQAFQTILASSSSKGFLILMECIKFANFCGKRVNLPNEPKINKNEIRYEKPLLKAPEYSFNGSSILKLSILNMPKYIFMHIYRNPLSHIRRAGIMLMEQLIKLNSLLIFNTKFVEESVKLVNEPTALVRKETLLSLDGILKTYPNCYPVIWAWCKIITPMCRDSDPRNIDIAMECFRTTVLLNIKTIEESTKAEHFMSWLIIRTLLSTQSRLYLENCFYMFLHQRQIGPQVVPTIESYLLTPYSTEAWIILNFLSGKVKSHEPDALIYHFTSSNEANSWNVMQNTLIALEVLSKYVHDFSKAALNHAFNYILGQIKEGAMLPTVVSKAYDFLLLIDMTTNRKKQKNVSRRKIADKPWVKELHKFLEDNILVEMTDFSQSHDALMSHLYTYTEVNVQTRLRPNLHIISFMQKFIIDYTKVKESGFDFENERLCNSMILLVGRLSIRDVCVARTSCNVYAQVLKVMDRPSVVNTILVVLTDLCKNHTLIVESIAPSVLDKLNSPHKVNRLQTFKCCEQLVLGDQFKLRGCLLMNLLTILLDPSDVLSCRAHNFFAEFRAQKNPSLFHKCLKECPFLFNEYKTFEVMDSYAEPHAQSPLKGETQLKRRHRLYEYFLKHLTDIKMISYFGQLEILADKSQDDPKLKSAEGIALIKDVLYILKRICQLTKEQKANEDEEDGIMKDENLYESHHDVGSEIGSGKIDGRKREMTMTEAIALLEKALILIPKIYKNVKAEGTALQKSFDDLCMALTIRFSNLVEYAQPVDFWMKYKQINDRNIKKRSYPKTKNSNDKENDSNNSNNSDDECPVAVKKANMAPIEDIPETMPDALYIEYLFEQNI